jgi:hypothetical protein
VAALAALDHDRVARVAARVDVADADAGARELGSEGKALRDRVGLRKRRFMLP